MKRTQRACALVVAMILLLGLSACGSREPSFEEVMTKAISELNNTGSMHCDMSMEITIAINEQSVSTTMFISMDSIADPVLAKADMSASSLGTSMNAMIYVEQNGDTYTKYISTDGRNWAAQTGLQMPEISQFTPQHALELYLSGSERFKKIGSDTINGFQAVRYDGSISTDFVSDVLEMSGMAAQFSSYGLTAEQFVELYRDTEDIRMSVWIDEESGLPVRSDLDMSETMNTIMGKLMKEILGDTPGFNLSLERAQITMMLSQFDSIDPIVIPDAVKNAAAGGDLV